MFWKGGLEAIKKYGWVLSFLGGGAIMKYIPVKN